MDAPNDVLEVVTKRGPGRPSKADRDAADIAAARAMAAKAPKNELEPEPNRDVISAATSSMVDMTASEAAGFELYGKVPAGKLKAMELKRNYRPIGGFEIVGHTLPELKRKNAIGVMEVVRKEMFVPDEMAPPPVPGITIPGKIWAGTVIRVGIDEAKTMRSNGIAEPSLEDD